MEYELIKEPDKFQLETSDKRHPIYRELKKEKKEALKKRRLRSGRYKHGRVGVKYKGTNG